MNVACLWVCVYKDQNKHTAQVAIRPSYYRNPPLKRKLPHSKTMKCTISYLFLFHNLSADYDPIPTDAPVSARTVIFQKQTLPSYNVIYSRGAVCRTHATDVINP
jgi:hypothetical protein